MDPLWDMALKWTGGIAASCTILAFAYKILKVRIVHDLKVQFDRILKKSEEDDKRLKRDLEKEQKWVRAEIKEINDSIERKVDMIVDVQMEFRELKGSTEATLKAQRDAMYLMNERICIRNNGRLNNGTSS